MKKDKIALQVYSVRDQMQEDFYGTLRKIKAFGYSGVEFAGLYGNDPLEVKKACEEMGLVSLSAHVPFVELMEHMEETIDCYKKLGVKYVVIPYLTPEYRPGNPGFQTVIDGMKKIGAALVKEGMVQQYHNHDFEFVKLDGEYALDILYKEIGPELLQTQIDTCWVNVGGESPVKYMKKYEGRQEIVHLKDSFGNRTKDENDTFEYRPVGHGLLDFKEILE